MLIRHDPHNELACQKRDELAPLLGDDLPADLCLVLGGDGFMLRTIHELGEHHTYLGVNCGRLGFLLNAMDETDSLLLRLRDQPQWHILQAQRLAAEVTDPEGRVTSDLALNDLYVERASGQTAHLRVSLNGQVVVKRLVCDGLIAATALGSTAYATAAGGVACHPSLPMLQLVAINPHIPRLRPIALPLDARVDVEVLDAKRRPARVVCDGRDLGAAARITVLGGQRPVRLAWLAGHDPTSTLIKKLLHA